MMAAQPDNFCIQYSPVSTTGVSEKVISTIRPKPQNYNTAKTRSRIQ